MKTATRKLTREEITSKLYVLTEKLAAEYAERDRQVEAGCELLARHHDLQAADLDLAIVRLENRLADLA